MNAFVASQFHNSKAEVLRRGTLVSYVLPYAETLELTGRLKGVVISGDHYNRASDRPCICPITHGETSVNEAWGIKIHSHKGIPAYLRPDLASFIGMSYGQVHPIVRRDTHQDCIFPAELVRRASEKFIEIIRPTPEKLLQRGHGFLAHGEIGWSDAFPRNNEDKADSAPIMNLTPPEVYKQTGMALVVRGYSHLERFLPLRDIAVGANRWFNTGFFSVTDIRALPVRGTLSSRSGHRAIPAGERALRGFTKKELGSLDDAIYAEVLARYRQPQGSLPPHVISSRKDNLQHYRR